jgi:hypothetical protein
MSNCVGAFAPKFILPTNNLPKPAPTQGLNGMNWEFFGVSGLCLCSRDFNRPINLNLYHDRANYSTDIKMST